MPTKSYYSLAQNLNSFPQWIKPICSSIWADEKFVTHLHRMVTESKGMKEIAYGEIIG